MGKDLGDFQIGIGVTACAARATSKVNTGTPVVAVIVVAFWINDFKAAATAIWTGWPVVSVTVLEPMNDVAFGIAEDNFLSTVGQ